MKFGPASPRDAIGGVTVHTLRQGPLVLKKGTTIGPAEVEALERAGIKDVVVVRMEEGDVSEDIAAASIALAVGGEGIHVERAFTGRANLFAAQPGVLVIDRAAVDRINNIDEAITFATLSAYKPVVEGEMVGTVKIIPFGVKGNLRDAAVKAAGRDVLKIAPYVIKRVGVVSTLLPGLSSKVIDKTLRVTAERLAPAGAGIIAERRVPHEEQALSAAIKELLGLGAELVIVFGASAIADRRDVIPAAVTGIGGEIEHFGMPVDPGNLLLIARAGAVPVLGAPGCARSPVENGFDWVLMRLLAGIKVTRSELMGMGVGGLLMEIVTRPQPRAKPEIEGNNQVAVIVLAAGRSTRMGGPNKLLAELDGKKLVRIATEQALASKASEVIVVTGHQTELIEQALQGLKVRFVKNPDFAGGIASSVKAGNRGRSRGVRRRRGLPRRHAADRRRPDRPSHRRVRTGPRQSHRRARQRRSPRQPCAVVAPLLQGVDDARRRCRRAPSDRQAHRGRRRSAGRRRERLPRHRHAAGIGSGTAGIAVRRVGKGAQRRAHHPSTRWCLIGRHASLCHPAARPGLNSTPRSPSGNNRRLQSPSPALGGGVFFHGFERRRAPLRDVFLCAVRLHRGRSPYHGCACRRCICGRQVRRLRPGL
ncbi:molybdopterin biosynthesis enzyme [Bradyrhizobium sp. GM22.5]